MLPDLCIIKIVVFGEVFVLGGSMKFKVLLLNVLFVFNNLFCAQLSVEYAPEFVYGYGGMFDAEEEYAVDDPVETEENFESQQALEELEVALIMAERCGYFNPEKPKTVNLSPKNPKPIKRDEINTSEKVKAVIEKKMVDSYLKDVMKTKDDIDYALLLSCKHGLSYAMLHYIRIGADLGVRTNDDQNILHLVVGSGNYICLKVLMKYLEDRLEIGKMKNLMYSISYYGLTPFGLVCSLSRVSNDYANMYKLFCDIIKKHFEQR